MHPELFPNGSKTGYSHPFWTLYRDTGRFSYQLDSELGHESEYCQCFNLLVPQSSLSVLVVS